MRQDARACRVETALRDREEYLATRDGKATTVSREPPGCVERRASQENQEYRVRLGKKADGGGRVKTEFRVRTEGLGSLVS